MNFENLFLNEAVFCFWILLIIFGLEKCSEFNCDHSEVAFPLLALLLTIEILWLFDIIVNDFLKLSDELLVDIVDLFTAQNDDRFLKILDD